MSLKISILFLCLTNFISVYCQQCELTRLEARKKFKAKDFVYDFNTAKPLNGSGGGTLKPLFVSQMPALQGEGVAFTLFKLDPCSINLPHTHPRATELLFVIFYKSIKKLKSFYLKLISAENLQVGFTEENGGREIINTIKTGQATLYDSFSCYMIHFQQNLGCKPAEFIVAFNNEDPGVISIAKQRFMLPDEALEATFVLSEEEILSIRPKLPSSPAKETEECRKRCGLHTESY